MSKRGHTNVNTLEGNITHPPDYRPEYGNLLSFSMAVHSDNPSEKYDDPMYIDVKVNGVSENTYKALVVGHEVRVTGQWQSKTFKKGDTQHRYYHLHVAHPCNFTLLSKPRKQQETVGQPAPALNGQGSTR